MSDDFTDPNGTPPAENLPESGDGSSPDPDPVYLLNRLLYKGVLPRYAFPTDVASFYVFDPNKSQYNRPAFRFSPSQGLAIALSQYAPGKEVWIANKRFVSGAIYSANSTDRFEAWRSKRLYYECKNCRFACTRAVELGQKGEKQDCPACGREQAFGEARYWFRPPGFAHPVTKPEDVSPTEQVVRSYATRAKLDAPSPPTDHASWKQVTNRARVHYLREQLLVTNTGPKQDGYTYCTLCGLIEPSASATGDLFRPHAKPYPDQKEPNCPGGRASTGVCLGTDFITDILLISLRVDDPIRLPPGLPATEIALRTLSEALAKAAATILDLEASEIQADFRAALTDDGQSGLEAEIYLYDTLAGGAGFAREAGQRAAEVLREALRLLGSCTCDSSCYRCLRSFKNKFEHGRLDRFLGRDLLMYVLDDITPKLSDQRSLRAAKVLSEDLRRQTAGTFTIVLNAKVDVPEVGAIVAPISVKSPEGRECIVAITHPLTPDTPPTDSLRDAQEFSSMPVFLVQDLKIWKNLPAATKAILEPMGVL